MVGGTDDPVVAGGEGRPLHVGDVPGYGVAKVAGLGEQRVEVYDVEASFTGGEELASTLRWGLGASRISEIIRSNGNITAGG